MAKPAIGIDLGTTHSCVGVWQHGKIEIIANDQGNRTTPSYVAFTDSERLIGDSAKNQAAINPKNTIFEAKRLIGRKFDDPLVLEDMKHWPFTVISDDDNLSVCVEYRGKAIKFAPEEISSMVLTKMKEIAEAYLDCEATDAVITVPAYFSDSQRQATKDAGTIAGLNVLRIINEPTAACLAYGLHKNFKGDRNVLIFDLGGGTFDVSILTIKEGSLFEVKSTAGDTHLGGGDFDNQLVKYLAEEFKRKHRKDLSVNPTAMSRLRTAAEQAKCTLSSCSIANIALYGLFDSIDFHTQVTRSKFENLCSDLFRATLVTVQQALADAKLSKEAIDDIVLVGGSTRIPKVQSLLQNFFCDKSLKHSVNPDEAVAFGAAVHAASLSGDSDMLIKDVLLLDVTPLSLGTSVSDGLMSTIIKRNTRIPCKVTKGFHTSSDNQVSVRVDVFEGERARAEDNNLLGLFNLCDLTPAPKRMTKIDVTFDLDANGILSVTAEERGTENSKTQVIRNTKGRLSEADIKRMVNEAIRFNEEDDKYRARTQARIKLEDYAYNGKLVAAEGGSKLSDEEKTVLEEQANNILSWLDKNNSGGLGEFIHKLEEIQKVCQPIMNKCEGFDKLLD